MYEYVKQFLAYIILNKYISYVYCFMIPLKVIYFNVGKWNFLLLNFGRRIFTIGTLKSDGKNTHINNVKLLMNSSIPSESKIIFMIYCKGENIFNEDSMLICYALYIYFLYVNLRAK